MNQSRTAIFAGVLAVLLAVAACGGGGNDGPSLAAGEVTCQKLTSESYEYSVHVDLDVGPVPTDAPTPTGQGRPEFHFTTTVNGKVENGNELEGTINNTDGHNETEYQAIQIGTTGYLNFGEGSATPGWQQNDTSQRPIPYPYWPMNLCLALAPDINTGQLGTSQSEDVSGVASDRYTITDLDSTFFSRSSDFGPSSDIVSYGAGLNGSIWVAKDGGYPTKFDVTGEGPYPSGQVLTVRIQLETSNMGGDIKVEAPALGTGN